jgi:hypothetical protein
MFSPDQGAGVASGEIIASIRLWSRPKANVIANRFGVGPLTPGPIDDDTLGFRIEFHVM